MPITYLIVAHLLSDFTFQPNRLIKMKYASPFGTLVHVSVFALVCVILLLPYLEFWQTWAVIGGVSVVHFVTDVMKINLSYKQGRKDFPVAFLLDQAVHLLSIIVGGLVLKNLDVNFAEGSFYLNIYIWIGLLFAIYVLFILDILFVQKRDSKKILNAKIFSFTTAFLVYLFVAVLM